MQEIIPQTKALKPLYFYLNYDTNNFMESLKNNSSFSENQLANYF